MFGRNVHSAGARVLEQGGPWAVIGGGAHGERMEREPITGIWGQSPQRGPEAEPPVRGRSPPEAESFLALGCATDRANLYHLQYCQQSITTLWIVVPPPAGADRRQIGNRTQAFKWYHFRWSWVKRTFQGHDNIQRQITGLIVSRVWSVQWFRFQWPWVTLNLDFKVTV